MKTTCMTRKRRVCFLRNCDAELHGSCTGEAATCAAPRDGALANRCSSVPCRKGLRGGIGSALLSFSWTECCKMQCRHFGLTLIDMAYAKPENGGVVNFVLLRGGMVIHGQGHQRASVMWPVRLFSSIQSKQLAPSCRSHDADSTCQPSPSSQSTDEVSSPRLWHRPPFPPVQATCP